MANLLTYLRNWRDQLWENRLWQNILLWVLLFLLIKLTAQVDEETTVAEVYGVILGLCVVIGLPIYVTNYLILPLWRKRRYAWGFLAYLWNLSFFAGLGPTILCAVASVITVLAGGEPVENDDFQVGEFLNLLGSLTIATLSGVAVRIARDSILQTNKSQAAELKLLKAQLNPHFLFNTLNNLYGLAVTKSDKLPDLMLKLSDLLRYSLYNTQEQWVPLSSELQYIQNYITLEQLRLEERTAIDYVQEGQADQQRIAPMLLIVFLENAFKHFGASDDEAAQIKIKLSISENKLLFSCYNTKDEHITESPRAQNTSGIGLANVRKRLNLLYPNRHELGIQNETSSFRVFLELQLDPLTSPQT
ncbi:MAG: sensor histidine kinase [Bacteroidota bacterium]